MSLKNVILEYDLELEDCKLANIVNELRYFIGNCQLYEDVIPTLFKLVQNEYELGLITDGDEENVTGILTKHKLNKMFKLKVMSSVIRSYKT